jgi:quercetin dioxygenase-like cupin family protein
MEFWKERLRPLDKQPEQVEIHSTDGLYVRQIAVELAGTTLPQHSHVWDHLTMVARGSVHVWAGDDPVGKRYNAPTGIMIKAGVKHTFMTLDDDTVMYCIHNLMGEDAVKILEEHQLTD